METAKELFQKKEQLKQLKEDQKIAAAPLEEEVEALQEKLLEQMTNDGLKSIKTEFANFAITSRKGYTFTNEIEARKWAIDTGAFAVDKRIAAQKLKELETLPDFVSETESRYLTIKPTS
jgi:hypothetical protein